MKKSIPTLIVISIILIVSCDLSPRNIKGIWISKYTLNLSKADTIMRKIGNQMRVFPTTPSENNVYTEKYEINRIFNFDEDSLFVSEFNETYYGNKIETLDLRYQYLIDSIEIVDRNNERYIHTIRNLNNQSLILSVKHNEEFEYEGEFQYIFHKLKPYLQAGNKLKTDSLLTNSRFRINKNENVLEFTPKKRFSSGKILSEDLLKMFGSKQEWETIQISNELFLAIGNLFLQITSIEEDKISAINYDQEIINYNLIPIQENKPENQVNILGSWQLDQVIAVDKLIDNVFYDPINSLIISDSLIHEYSTIGHKTSAWKLNVYNDKIIIKDSLYDFMEVKSYWNILDYNSEYLTIERIRGNWDNYFEVLNTEQLIFKRNE